MPYTHTHTHILLYSSKTPQGCSLDQEMFLSLPQNIYIYISSLQQAPQNFEAVSRSFLTRARRVPNFLLELEGNSSSPPSFSATLDVVHSSRYSPRASAVSTRLLGIQPTQWHFADSFMGTENPKPASFHVQHIRKPMFVTLPQSLQGGTM